MALFKKHDSHQSILAGQKLKKRRPSFPFTKLSFALFSLGLGLVSLGLGVGAYRLKLTSPDAVLTWLQQKASTKQAQPHRWLFRYQQSPSSASTLAQHNSVATASAREGFSPITTADQDRIEALAKTRLKDNSPESLRAFAEAILDGSAYNKIHLYAYEPYSLMISLGKHSPLFAVYADKWRYVSSEGSVYGDAQEATVTKLHGVFTERTQPYTLKRQNELELSEFEAAVIQEAVALHAAAMQENFLITAINFKKYRGFFVTLADSGTVIALGKAPFNGKIKKLRKILYLLATKGQQAASIELDFDDKAFIKEYSF